MSEVRRPVRIANCSGFFGDRLDAAREMVEGGPIDVLTGDWLAELTMLILARQRMKHGAGSGYARTFLTQMEQVLGTCLERGIKVVSNAGGLDPARVRRRAARDGRPSAASTCGSPTSRATTSCRASTSSPTAGETFTNLDTGEAFSSFGMPALTANAYLGGRGITAALDAGADVVITGRVTDAALVVGPAAWWHGWDYDDAASLDALAGAVVAGHVIECGAQATGGNYAFFTEVPGLEHVGFPLAEVAADGSSVIGKHDGTGGLVSVGTVTAQLLYEIAGPAYANPDVTARFDTIALEQDGAGPRRDHRRRAATPPRARSRSRSTPSAASATRVARAHRARHRGQGRPRAAHGRGNPSGPGTLGHRAGERRGVDARRARARRAAAAPRPRGPAHDRRRAGRAAAHREGRRPEEGRQGVHRADRRERARRPTPACSPPRRRPRARRTASTGRPRCPPSS